ncbi:MAG: PaREP1 family protein [Candidatus Korarchaeum sp.]
MDELAEGLGDSELRRLWRTADVLHQNFYGSWMPPREVELSIRDIKMLIERLRTIS